LLALRGARPRTFSRKREPGGWCGELLVVTATGENDASLIEDSWAQPSEFAGLFDRHFRAVYGFCGRRAGWQDADDLAGETFRRAFEHRRRYDPSCPDARPWLYGIALNIMRDHFRGAGRRAIAYGRLEGEASERVCDFTVAVGAALDAKRDLDVVTSALADLPRGEVEALLLHVWERLTYEQVGVALGVPVGTVRSRISRVRGRLRELLALRGELPDDPRVETTGR
jgi:RNA polymerase sigma factor (sigma-70 family)